MNWKLLLLTSLLAASASVFAQDRNELYRGIRTQAMGGAAIGVVDDQTALLLNPAAMAKLREPYVTVADPVVEINQKDDKMASGDINLLNVLPDPQKALKAANANPGSMMDGLLEMFPSIVFQNFGIGVLGRESYNAEVNTAQTAYDYQYDQDIALVTGFNFRLWDGIFKFGMNARLMNRSQVSQPNLSPTATNLTIGSMLDEGMGLGSDAGIILTAPIRWLPSLSAVVRDIGGTSYTLRSGILHNTTNAPDMTPQTINAAFTIAPIISKKVRSLWTVEYEDCTNAWQDTISQRHYHAGVEFNFDDLLFIRGGYNEGYWTAGIEFAISRYELQLTSYGEEVGTSPANLQEDRRYMGGFAIRF